MLLCAGAMQRLSVVTPPVPVFNNGGTFWEYRLALHNKIELPYLNLYTEPSAYGVVKFLGYYETFAHYFRLVILRTT